MKKFRILGAAAGHCCSECGRGFYCWTGPDESPCGHNLSQFKKSDLRKYLKEVPENKKVREFLENGKAKSRARRLSDKKLKKLAKKCYTEYVSPFSKQGVA